MIIYTGLLTIILLSSCSTSFKVLTSFGGNVRGDRRCGGGEFALQDGSPSQCDPTSENPCCSKWGFCGPDADHCACEGCVDYRTTDQRGSQIFYISQPILVILESK